MTERAERIERVRLLLEWRRHPERRVGILSATNFTRLAIRFIGMSIAAGLVHAVLGGTILEVPIAAIAVGAVDAGTAQLWGHLGDRVRRFWRVAGVVGLAVAGVAILIPTLAPDSGLTRALRGRAEGVMESQRAAFDRRTRARRIPVDLAAAAGERWRLLVDSGAVRQGTYDEAAQWCAALGPEWRLPPGLGEWPKLESYPDLGTILYVWSLGRSGIQVGDGKEPGVAVSSDHRATEVRGVLCLKGGQ